MRFRSKLLKPMPGSRKPTRISCIAFRSGSSKSTPTSSALEAEIKQSNAKAKADLDQRIAADKQARQALRSKVKDTLSSRLNHLKSEAESLKAQAAQARGQAKAKLDQRVAKLQADIAAEQQRIDQMDEAEDAAWDAMAKSHQRRRSAQYWAAIDEAEHEIEAKHD